MRMFGFGSLATLLLTLTPVVASAAPAKSAKPTKKPEATAEAPHAAAAKPVHGKHVRASDRTRGQKGFIIVEKGEKAADAKVAHKSEKADKADHDAKVLPPLPAASLTTPIGPSSTHGKAGKVAKGKTHGAHGHASADKGDKADVETSMKGAHTHKGEPKSDKVIASGNKEKGEKSDKADKIAKVDANKMPLLRADVPLITASTAKPSFKPGCVRPAVTFFRGTEEEAFVLTKCDGSVAPLAVERLSVLARAGAVKPSRSAAELAKAKGPVLAPGVHRIDPRLAEDMQRVVDHFAKAGKTPNVHLVSGYRPTSEGSFHQSGHAIDFRLEGVQNEAIVEFCKTLSDVGCGYYPNSSFVHMDVREAGTGHVSWIDASGPGESPRYVSEWPPKKPKFITAIEESLAKLEKGEGEKASEKSKTNDADDKNADAPAAALTAPLDDDFNGAR